MAVYKMKRTLIFSIIFSFNVFSQIRFQGNAGITYPFLPIGDEDGLYQYWKYGLNIGAGADIPLFNEFSFKPIFEYQYYFFDQYKTDFSAGSKVIGSKGYGAQLINLQGDFVLNGTRTDNSNLFFALGIGYVIERPGKMTITWQDYESSSRDIYSTEYQVMNRNYLSYYVSLGYVYSISKLLDVNILVTYSTNKVETKSFSTLYNSVLLFNCGVSYEIINL